MTLTYCCRDVFMFLASEFSALSLHPRAPELEYAAVELEAWPAGSHVYVLNLPVDSTLQNVAFAFPPLCRYSAMCFVVALGQLLMDRAGYWEEAAQV